MGEPKVHVGGVNFFRIWHRNKRKADVIRCPYKLVYTFDTLKTFDIFIRIKNLLAYSNLWSLLQIPLKLFMKYTISQFQCPYKIPNRTIRSTPRKQWQLCRPLLSRGQPAVVLQATTPLFPCEDHTLGLGGEKSLFRQQRVKMPVVFLRLLPFTKQQFLQSDWRPCFVPLTHPPFNFCTRNREQRLALPVKRIVVSEGISLMSTTNGNPRELFVYRKKNLTPFLF